jgi:hypothetical protein
MDDFLVTAEDLFTVPNFRGGTGMCARGARAWALQRGFNYLGFVREGILASVLLATDDALAIRLVEHARERRRG